MVHDLAEHDLLARLFGPAPAEAHRLSEPISDFDYWQQRSADRRGEVVFGILRRSPSGERMVIARGPDYPAGVFRVPSGGIRHGEAAIDALWREVAEEFGVPFRVLAYAGKIDFVFPHPAGGPAIQFASYCFLVEQTGDAAPQLPSSAVQEIAAVREVGIEELVGHAAGLAALAGRWADWGHYRAHSTARLAKAWARRRAEVETTLRRAAALQCGDGGLLDVSHRVGRDGAASYPGDAVPTFALGMRRAPGAATGWHTTRWELSAHAGTHVDAPAHYLAAGPTIDTLALSQLFGPAVTFDARRATAAGRAALAADLLPAQIDLVRGRIALIKLGLGGEIGAGRFPREHMGLSAELARQLVELDVRAVGTDAMSVDPYGGAQAHETLLSAGIPVIELLNLEQVEEGPCGFAALPLRLVGAEAAPCRAVWWPCDDDEPFFGPPCAEGR